MDGRKNRLQNMVALT